MTSRRRSLLHALVLCCILLGPSLWMLANLPPLWRDADAYAQLVRPPGMSTIQGHGSLYPLLVRLPLYLGFQLERFSGNEGPAQAFTFAHPPLTDAGIFLLIGGQHLALCAGAYALLVAAAQNFWCRLFGALFVASNSIFYALAHCVGSESLSLLCTLALTLAGLRLLRNDPEGRLKRYVLFAGALVACLLTRYANLFLIFVLPLTFLLLAVLQRRRALLREAGVALAIGLLSLGVARLAAEVICQTVGRSYYSRPGFTFLWRMNYLATVPEPRRAAMLSEISARTNSADGRVLISLLQTMLDTGEPLNPPVIFHRFRDALSTPEKRGNVRRVHRALNAVASAFILRPTPEHWRAARDDLREAFRLPLPQATSALFATTAYCFEHIGELPGLANLSTFQKHTAAEIMAVPGSHSYFRGWSFLSLGSALLLSLGAAAVAGFTRWRFEHRIPPGMPYAVALVSIGVLMIAVTAVVADLIPRYTFPLWGLLWFATVIHAGLITSGIAARKQSLVL